MVYLYTQHINDSNIFNLSGLVELFLQLLYSFWHCNLHMVVITYKKKIPKFLQTVSRVFFLSNIQISI